MTEHTVRLYAAVVGLVVFFLFWAAVAAKPWAATGRATRARRPSSAASRSSRVRPVA